MVSHSELLHICQTSNNRFTTTKQHLIIYQLHSTCIGAPAVFLTMIIIEVRYLLPTAAIVIGLLSTHVKTQYCFNLTAKYLLLMLEKTLNLRFLNLQTILYRFLVQL